MKKNMPLFLALLLLTACGTAPAAPVREDSPAPTEIPTVRSESSAPEDPEITQEDNPMKENTRGESEEGVVLSEETVTLDGVDSYLRLTLPQGWTWTAGKEGAEQKSLLLYAASDDGFKMEINWWDSFGMCGTGVTFQEVVLPNGLNATLATEKNEDLVCWTLILPYSPGQFTLQLSATQEEIDAHQAEIDAMIESLQLGALSHIPPQPQPPRDSI